MRYFDDGKVGVSFESHVGTVRLLDRPAASGHPQFVGSGSVIRLSLGVAKLVGFTGKMSMRHQALLARALVEQGFRILYVERIEGHRTPLGVRITEGDFANWFRVDLEAAAKRAGARYSKDA